VDSVEVLDDRPGANVLHDVVDHARCVAGILGIRIGFQIGEDYRPVFARQDPRKHYQPFEVGRPEVDRLAVTGGANQTVRVFDLAAHVARRFQHQATMRVRVVAEFMTSSGDANCEIRVVPERGAHGEERGSDVRVGQHRENRIGVVCNGPIVEGQGNDGVGRLHTRDELSKRLVFAGTAQIPAGPDDDKGRQQDQHQRTNKP
jgi:hypothetical protein